MQIMITSNIEIHYYEVKGLRFHDKVSHAISSGEYCVEGIGWRAFPEKCRVRVYTPNSFIDYEIMGINK